MLGQIMNRPAERAGAVRGLQQPIRGRIEFDRVTFRYGEGTSPALNEVSFAVPAGGVLGVVGRSGSGKTTLTRLIRGIYAVQSGSIRLDGHDIREFDLAHLRGSIGVVLQSSFLFRGTVRENIAVAKPDATLEEVVRAAQLSGADEFIQQLAQGYDTPLEEGGKNLSGGQQQRIAIARALMREPRILILDEATSSLDPESESLVQANLDAIAAGRTVIIVSHRLSSLVGSDRILVLERGDVVDQGRHAELLSRCQIYRQLWNQQHRHLRSA
jgi:ATP-binding cassette subfamily B protein